MQSRHRHAIRSTFLMTALLLFALPFRATGQTAPHVVVVKMVDKSNGQFAFEPAAFNAQSGDTIRFVQASSAPHNVHFTQTPKGAKLGAAASGPYVMAANQSYDVLLDARFPAGTYQFICDPHQSVGMAGTMMVGAPAK